MWLPLGKGARLSSFPSVGFVQAANLGAKVTHHVFSFFQIYASSEALGGGATPWFLRRQRHHI